MAPTHPTRATLLRVEIVEWLKWIDEAEVAEKDRNNNLILEQQVAVCQNLHDYSERKVSFSRALSAERLWWLLDVGWRNQARNKWSSLWEFGYENFPI